MADFDATPSNVVALTKIVNASIHRKILTEDNFEVVDIRHDTTTPRGNTSAVILVDLSINSPRAPIGVDDRYSRRSIIYSRIDLRDIAEFRKLPKDKNGSYVVSGLTASDIISSLNANIEEDELVIRVTGTSANVAAHSRSLGYIGSISVSTESAVEEDGDKEPEAPTEPTPVQVTAVKVNGAVEQIVKTESLITYTVTPADAEVTDVKYASANGTITADGKYTPEQVGIDTITVTVNGVEGKLTVNVGYTPVTDILIDAPKSLTVGEKGTVTIMVVPDDVSPDSVPQFSATYGTITRDGEYTAPATAGTDTVTVTIESITRTVTIDIVEAPVGE